MTTPWYHRTPAARFAYFPVQHRPPSDRWTVLRRAAEMLPLSPGARLRLEWMIFYETVGRRNARATARHFGVSRKTFHKWRTRFSASRLRALEEHSRAPRHRRRWDVTGTEEARVVALRRSHLRWGREKLQRWYAETYQDSISAWKIGRVIAKWNLYPDRNRHRKDVARRSQSSQRVRIHQLSGDVPFNALWHIDAIILWWYGVRRVIFTALEHLTKMGYARAYETNSSKNAREFLYRLRYLTGDEYPMGVTHTDNGAEFEAFFAQACHTLGIQQVYSRVRTPTDNAALERFNRTLQEEWLEDSTVGLDDLEAANDDLTEWLVTYNSERPHAALDYQTPLGYAQQHYFPVLPMWPTRTHS